MNFSDRIQTFEDLLSGNGASWDGMLLLAGDINLDIFRPEMSEMNYNELLDSLNVKQMVTKATRIAKTSKTLIDHIITNAPKRITYIEVLPCPQVSDRYVRLLAWGLHVMYLDISSSGTKNVFLKRLLLRTSLLCP